MGYQFFLPMVLRWRASRAEAPLLKNTSTKLEVVISNIDKSKRITHHDRSNGIQQLGDYKKCLGDSIYNLLESFR